MVTIRIIGSRDWFDYFSIGIAVLSLLLSFAAFQTATKTLNETQIKLNDLNITFIRFYENSVFFATPECDRFYATRNATNGIHYIGCYNRSKMWDVCIDGFAYFGCHSKSWFNELRKSYSWNDTEGSW